MKQKHHPIDLSIIIVSYNTKDLLFDCLGSIAKTANCEVIVSDNGSTDESVAMVKREFPWVRCIENKENIGFSAANNRGIAFARGRYILLLNSDTVVPPGSLESMITFMDAHPEAGAATAKLLLTDGSMDPACHRGFPTPWVAATYLVKLEALFPRTRLFGEYHQGYKDLETIHMVDVISGAFFFVRKRVIDEVGLLDEDFFMYAEDIDWSYRIRKQGWNIYFNPHIQVLHKKGQSGRTHGQLVRRKKTEILFHQNNWRFYTKHFASTYPPFVTWLVHMVYTVRIALIDVFGI